MLRLVSLAAFIAAWHFGSLAAGEQMLPGPATVLASILAEAHSGALFFNLGATLARVFAAFTLAMTLGAAIGYLMGRLAIVDRLGDPWLLVFLNLPALVIIV